MLGDNLQILYTVQHLTSIYSQFAQGLGLYTVVVNLFLISCGYGLNTIRNLYKKNLYIVSTRKSPIESPVSV